MLMKTIIIKIQNSVKSKKYRRNMVDSKLLTNILYGLACRYLTKSVSRTVKTTGDGRQRSAPRH